MKARALFTQHPASVGESYAQHLWVAASFGVRMLIGGCACLLHGLFPFLFMHTGSRCIEALHGAMATRRGAAQTAHRDSTPASSRLGLQRH